jgi:hypothetical protein
MKGADEQGGMRERGAFVVGAVQDGRSWKCRRRGSSGGWTDRMKGADEQGGMRELGRKKAARNGLLEEVVRAPRSAGPKKPAPRSAGQKNPGGKPNR